MVTLPCISLAISSSAGPIILHGPHHSAQKSTTTGPLDPTTSDLKLASVTLTVDMNHLSPTRARDNTQRATVRKGKNAARLRQDFCTDLAASIASARRNSGSASASRFVARSKTARLLR